MSGTKLFASTSWAGSAAPPTTGGHLSLQLPFDLDDAGQDDLIVKADAPKALRKALSADMPKIGHNCVRENAKRILRWYEQIIIKHVLKGQTKSDAFRALTGRRADEELSAAERGAAAQRTAAMAYARSSLLAADPWGDEEVPEDLASDSTEGAEARRTLLRTLQDPNKAYARVHLARILHKEVYTPVRTRELEYKAHKDLRDATVDGAMSWKEIKSIVLDKCTQMMGCTPSAYFLLCNETVETRTCNGCNE